MKTEELTKAILNAQKVAHANCVDIKEIAISHYFLDSPTEVYPTEFLGIKINNAKPNKSTHK